MDICVVGGLGGVQVVRSWFAGTGGSGWVLFGCRWDGWDGLI